MNEAETKEEKAEETRLLRKKREPEVLCAGARRAATEGPPSTGHSHCKLYKVPGEQDRLVTLLPGSSQQGAEVPTLQVRRLRLSGVKSFV